MKVSVSVEAGVTVTWSLGGNKHLHASFIDGAISMTDGALTVTDPGHLHHLASRFENAATLFRDSLGKSKTTKVSIVPRGEPLPTVDLKLLGKTFPVPLLRDAELSVHNKPGLAKTTVEVTVTAGFKQSLPGYGDFRGEFSITAKAEVKPEPKRRSQVPAYLPEEVIAAVVLLLALRLARPTITGRR